MTINNLYPIKFTPIFKEKVWGGRNLKKLFDKTLPPGKNIGESWEICDRHQDQSIVENGPLAGQTLHAIMITFKQDLLGKVFTTVPKHFPLLFKIIDAQENLSLQVHPDDTFASKYEKEDPGKTELWYVFHHKKRAKIYCGLKQSSLAETFKKDLESCAILKHLQTYSSQEGDVFFIPPGTVHALGKGNIVVEIQVNSDLTYRLYDWKRKEDNARPLHIEKGRQVIQFGNDQKTFHMHSSVNKTLVDCSDFIVSEQLFEKSFVQRIDPQSFQVWFIIEGRGLLNQVSFQKGDFILIPSSIGSISGEFKVPTRILKTFAGPNLQKNLAKPSAF